MDSTLAVVPPAKGRLTRNPLLLVYALAVALSASDGLRAQLAAVGLSTVRSHRFGRSDLPNATNGGGDLLGFALATGDFNGDGAADLAAGAPFNYGPPAAPVGKCGEVIVRYGQPRAGLANSMPPTVLGQFVAGSSNPAEFDDQLGWAAVACNLNGDAYDDLVVGVPGEDLSISTLEFTDAGVVEVYYGTGAGLVPPASARFREVPAPGEVNFPTSFSSFGFAIACDDFNDDGFDDLAVGVPFRDLPNGSADAGRVNIFPGSGTGIGGSSKVLDQTILGAGDLGAPDERFGNALATGDFDGDGYADLAVGVPLETAATTNPGAVHFIYGGASGLPSGGNLLLNQVDFDPHIEREGFGSTLGVGDFDADGYADLVAGATGWPVFGNESAGLVFALYGSSSGVNGLRHESFTEASIFGSGASGANEAFGFAMAAGDFDGDGVDDVAIGAPGELRPPFDHAGGVAVVMGAEGTGLEPDPNRNHLFLPGVYGVPGSLTEVGMSWGRALAAGDFDGDGTYDLAVGAPFEEEDGFSSVGTLTILLGALFADGFETHEVDQWSDSAP